MRYKFFEKATLTSAGITGWFQILINMKRKKLSGAEIENNTSTNKELNDSYVDMHAKVKSPGRSALASVCGLDTSGQPATSPTPN